MSKYTMQAHTKSKNYKRMTAMVNKGAVEQAAQMFLDLYMSPGEFSDAPYRLGRPVAVEEATDEENTDTWLDADASGFPPYSSEFNTVSKPALPKRLAGGKAVNDRINHLQRLLRIITGQIRTKITEWDISLYLQEEELFDRDVPQNYSILYRLLNDNPRKYRDSRAFTAFALLNASMGRYRWWRWNPRSDSDLRWWAPPTSSLSLWANPPRPQKRWRKITYRTWWGRRRTKWRSYWYVPKRPRLNRVQQQEVHLALNAKWNHWYPRLWQLFFWSPDLNSLGPEDEKALFNERGDVGSDFKKLKRKKRSRNDSAKRQAYRASGNPLSLKQGRDTGINMLSPILRGRPWGRYKDPRSIAGYLENSPNNLRLPKIAPTSWKGHPINRRYAHTNPVEGMNRLLNGWSSPYKRKEIITERRRVFVSVDSDSGSYQGGYRVRNYRYTNSRGRTYYRRGYYDYRDVQIPIWVNATMTGEYPNARFSIVHHTNPFWSFWRIFTMLFFPFGTIAALRAKPHSDMVIKRIYGIDQNVIKNKLEENTIPAMIVTADKRIVATIPISNTTITEKRTERVRWRFLWWSGWRRVTRHVQVEAFSVNPGAVTQYAAGLRSPRVSRWVWWRRNKTPSLTRTSNYNVYPRFLGEIVRPGRTTFFRGLFFNLPARTLSDNDNIITSKWPSASAAVGPTLARGLTTGMWKYGRGYIGAPLAANYAGLYRKLKPVAPAIRELSVLLQTIKPKTVQQLIKTLERDTLKRPEVQRALRTFRARNMIRLQSQLSFTANTIDNLMADLGAIASGGESALTVGRLRSIYYTYPRVATLVGSPFLKHMLDAYLTLLYEWRIVYLKQRINKVDGTLMNLARLEVAMKLMVDSDAIPPSPGDALISEELEVKHKVTNQSLERKAWAKQNNRSLGTERTRIVYVPVQYDSEGEIIRHTAARYQLVSMEYFKKTGQKDVSVEDVSFWITFTGPNQPKIVQNVMTTIDGTNLQRVIANPNLTMLEKICAARQLEDWWEIHIPRRKWPKTIDYGTQMMLIIAPEDSEIESAGELFGGMPLHPIQETSGRQMMGSSFEVNQQIKDLLDMRIKTD